MSELKRRKKLIEVALPLDAINRGAQQEKNPFLKGHPRSLHLWWARRPLAACRAILFATLVDDPSSSPEEFPTEELQEKERGRLFGIIEKFVRWENWNDKGIFDEAIKEIIKSTNGKIPCILDPFCGGGSIPIEAQRLGLKVQASDINPLAVLITKGLVEIPFRFINQKPVGPLSKNEKQIDNYDNWSGLDCLVEDLRRYSYLIKEKAKSKIGHLYPKIVPPKSKGVKEVPIIAWLWARTIKSPNPACSNIDVPLISSFYLSNKKGREAYLEPIINGKNYRFAVRSGKPRQIDTIKNGTKIGKAAFKCIISNTPITAAYIRSEGKARRMGVKLIAVIAEGPKGRIYLEADSQQEQIAISAKPKWIPDQLLPNNPRYIAPPLYGMPTYADLFTSRQLVALNTFIELIKEIHGQVIRDAEKANLQKDNIPLEKGGRGARAYADAIATYLTFGVGHLARYSCALATWNNKNENVAQVFGRQALPMVWDFAECNALEGVLNIESTVTWVSQTIRCLPAKTESTVKQLDAVYLKSSDKYVVATDPPYYDNIAYSDLADFFYVWLRPALSQIYPDLFSTLLTPKQGELIASVYRFDGDKKKSRDFFEEGLSKVFNNIFKIQDQDYPFTLYYAFKQTESNKDKEDNLVVASTGWETMLQGLLKSGFTITGTWPLRTERDQGLKTGINALASSIVLVCRPRSQTSPIATRREFVAQLKKELPLALKMLQHGNIAPVDFAQSSIGPGMEIFSRYSKVLEADGEQMSVRTALQIINQELDAYLAMQEEDFDRDTRFCLAWFEQYSKQEGPFGDADVLARAKNTSVNGLVESGVLISGAGKVRLLKRSEYPEDYDPAQDKRLTIWECVQHMINALNKSGEIGAARLCAKLGSGASEAVRSLAYRLYSICERKGWTDEALAYNALITSWPEIQAKVPSVMTEANFPETLF